MDFREEKDSLGPVKIPAQAYYGPQTQRATDNFPDSGLKMPDPFIKALALVKKCAAETNGQLGELDGRVAGAISRAAQAVMDGHHHDHFVVDVFQTGSGTSTNMNMNEVLANRANALLEGENAGERPVHPNDHVNHGQSSNDVIPTALHIAAASEITRFLIPQLQRLHTVLVHKADEFEDIEKIGRTHLQDAVPLALGQEFSGYARQIELGIQRVRSTMPRLLELAIGGTAVGTGLNAHPDFAESVIKKISDALGLPFAEAGNHFEAQAAQDAAVEVSGALKTLAVGFIKIANDIRWLASGPRCGLGEIRLPALQPGSSIMPGKVNPVIPESVIQIAYQVMGHDTAIVMGGQSGVLELNLALPLITYNLLQSIKIMGLSAQFFADKCISGITADRQTCINFIEKSLSLATGFVPHLGYDRSAELAKKAYQSGKTIRQVALEDNVLPVDIIQSILGDKK